MIYTEKGTVEDFIIEELQKLGWKFIPPDEMRKLRKRDYEEPLVVELLKRAICRINENVEFTNADLDFILTRLRTIPSNIEGIKEFLYYLKFGLKVPLQKRGKERIIKLVDYSKIENNEFVVTRQYWVEGLKETIRADIVLLLNGIPVVVIECKSPTREEVSWYDAYKQIRRYEEQAPQLFKFVQFCITTDGIEMKYFPNCYKDTDEVRNWRDPYPFKGEIKKDLLIATIYGLLSKKNLVDLLENFIFIRTEDKRTTKVMARYMQFRATNKIFERAISWIKGEDDKRFGLIWHWQGSGKTYTMAFSAWKLYHCLEAENPSIFVVVDRKELEEQIEKDFKFIGVPLERVTSIKNLIEVLTWGNSGKRGIFLVTIEKFSPKEFKRLEVENIVIKRRNVIVLADEVHRTHYGKFATMMRSVFAEACIFGFTGTPLSKRERNTFQKFCPPGELYLDRYSMLDSLQDGFTIPLRYKAELPQYHLRKEQLKILAKFEREEIEELTPEERRALRRKVRAVKAIVKKPERINAIAKNIADHFKQVVEETGLKAMVVTIDREACVLYKNALNRYLPDDYSEVVMTFNPNDKRTIREYFEKLTERYGTKDLKTVHSKIIENFKEREKPKILIVTDMLITGFDAPILWVVYLDKSLKEHRILQTIARTNRPYSNKKFGFIVDYIGVLKELKEALEKFEKSDARDLKIVIRDLSEEEKEFKKLLRELLSMFEGIKREDTRESLELALNILIDEEKSKEFKRKVKQLMKSYEMLKGEPFLVKYLSDYTWLTKVYIAYYKKFEKIGIDELKIEKLSRKTTLLIQETVDIQGIEKIYPIITIDKRYVQRLRKEPPKSIDAALDVISNIRHEIRTHPYSPFFRSLREDVEKVFEELRRRRKLTKEVIQKILGYTERITRWKEEEQKIGRERLLLYETVKNILPEEDKERVLHFVDKLLSILRKKKLLFPGWQEQREVRKAVKREIRLHILTTFKERKDKIDELMEDLFRSLGELR